MDHIVLLKKCKSLGYLIDQIFQELATIAKLVVQRSMSDDIRSLWHWFTLFYIVFLVNVK